VRDFSVLPSESGVKLQTVAIVDDRETNLKILERLARTLEGVEVETYDRPQNALDAFAAAPPDLVITDFNMPELDGAAFIRQIRELPPCVDVPVIVITAYEDRDLRYRALESGATDFLLSPVDHHEFRVRSRNLLTLRRQQLLLKARASSLEERMVEESRRHRDALRESHELLLRVIDAVPVAVVATDRDGRYVFINDWFARSVGKKPAAIIGQTPEAVSNDSHARGETERDRRIIAELEKPGSCEETVRTPKGEERVLLTTKALLKDQAGRPMLVVTVALDITERKEAELTLVAAKEEAELASRSKSEFLANMSHELRTPLNAIIGFSQVMADEVMGPMGSPRYTGYARDICASAQHLLGIISDILDVSKLEAGKVELDEEEAEIPQIVRDVMQLVAERARALDISIDTDIAPKLPRYRVDSLKLKQVLLNLITNAIKFSHSGGHVELSARFGKQNGLEIAVSDHGIGMDKVEIETAVTRFGQVASTWSRRHAGTGLGLPLAIGLVELHGGRLTIESVKDSGTTVRVFLPVERALPSPAAATA
jgi:two-component system, cell cycle sensor histidine kinase PleC